MKLKKEYEQPQIEILYFTTEITAANMSASDISGSDLISCYGNDITE